MITKAADTFQFDAIDDVVSDIAKGRIVIVTDDADRENEGDLVIAAEKVTPEAVNFMATHGRGLICVPISNERAEQLGLQRMVTQNREAQRRFHGFSGRGARGHHRHQRLRSRDDNFGDRESALIAGRSDSTGTCVSVARQRRRSAAARRSH